MSSETQRESGVPSNVRSGERWMSTLYAQPRREELTGSIQNEDNVLAECLALAFLRSNDLKNEIGSAQPFPFADNVGQYRWRKHSRPIRRGYGRHHELLVERYNEFDERVVEGLVRLLSCLLNKGEQVRNELVAEESCDDLTSAY